MVSICCLAQHCMSATEGICEWFSEICNFMHGKHWFLCSVHYNLYSVMRVMLYSVCEETVQHMFALVL
jgi:hypothetical protein